MSDANKRLARDMFDAWNARDFDRFAACFAASCNGGGAEGARKEAEAFVAAFPDLVITLEDLLAEGDRMATRVTMRATHGGSFAGIPPTGRPVVIKANHLFRCENGKIVQRHGQSDRLELMMQLGMTLAPAAEKR